MGPVIADVALWIARSISCGFYPLERVMDTYRFESCDRG